MPSIRRASPKGDRDRGRKRSRIMPLQRLVLGNAAVFYETGLNSPEVVSGSDAQISLHFPLPRRLRHNSHIRPNRLSGSNRYGMTERFELLQQVAVSEKSGRPNTPNPQLAVTIHFLPALRHRRRPHSETFFEERYLVFQR